MRTTAWSAVLPSLESEKWEARATAEVGVSDEHILCVVWAVVLCDVENRGVRSYGVAEP